MSLQDVDTAADTIVIKDVHSEVTCVASGGNTMMITIGIKPPLCLYYYHGCNKPVLNDLIDSTTTLV